MDNHEGYLVSMNHILVYIRVYIYTYKYIYIHMRIYYIDLYSIYNTCCGLISYDSAGRSITFSDVAHRARSF